jgi:hypothetical protein
LKEKKERLGSTGKWKNFENDEILSCRVPLGQLQRRPEGKRTACDKLKNA